MILNGRAWCQRHANSVKWLTARDGSIYEMHHVAAMNDRSPNLVGILVDELNEEVSAHLRRSFGDHRDVRIITDGTVRAIRVPRSSVKHTPQGPQVLSTGSHTAWARGWGAYSHVGYLARVVLQVTPTEPPAVQVYVNGHIVLSRVPDWITNRGRSTDESQDHHTFNRAILDAIRSSTIVQHDDP